MPDRIISAMARALFSKDMVSARIMLAISEFLWFALLAWPGDTFGRPTYAGMGAVMPEECWALVFLATSMMQAHIIGSEDFHSREARYFAAYNAALWLFVVGSMLASVYPPPAAISGEITLAIASLWIYIKPHIERWLIIKSWRTVHDRKMRGL